eukprot:168067_1
MLIIYKRWLQTIYKKTNGKDSIYETTQVDFSIIDNQTYKATFIQFVKSFKHKKFSNDNLKTLLKMIENNIDNISEINTFLNKEQFATSIKMHTGIIPFFSKRIHKNIEKFLTPKAQAIQYGTFLSDLDMEQIDSDYYHILISHIYNGDETTIKNAFAFFGTVVHFDDTPDEKEECRSKERREQRRDRNRNAINCSDEQKDENKNMNNAPDKNIWKLKNIYNQNQLDTIHHYLVHSEWRRLVPQYANQYGENKSENISEALKEDDLKETNDKYVTDLSGSDVQQYGFGIDMSHPHLVPKYASVYHELLFNKLYTVREQIFHSLLVKAIRLYRLVSGKKYV